MKLTRITATLGAALLTLAFAVPVFAAPHEGNPGGNCNEGITKVEATSDGELDDIVLAAGTVFCVKASDANTGTLVADGTTTLKDYLKQEGIVGGDGEGRFVSNYVVYETPTPTPTPEETPTPTPEETPTPTPEETPTPTPEETPTPTPTPTPEDSVGGETATPPTVTLPPTDAIGSPATPGTSAWAVLAVVLAGIVASVFVLTPSRRRR